MAGRTEVTEDQEKIGRRAQGGGIGAQRAESNFGNGLRAQKTKKTYFSGDEKSCYFS